MRYAGLDVHQKQSTVHVMDGNGREVLRRTVHGPWSKVVRTLAQVKRPLSVCFEASSGYGYRHRDLLQVADRVVVAHPGKLRLIFASKRKNDSVDAKRLALLLAVNEVPAVHVPGADVQGWRRAIHRRRQLVAERTRAKNALRALLREVGLRPPKGLWTVKGMTWLRAQDLEEAMDALNRDYLAEQVQRLTEQITRFQKGLDRIARAHPGVASPAPSRSAATSGWCPARTPAPAPIGWGTSRARAPAWCGACWPRRRGRACVARRGFGRPSSVCCTGIRNARRSRSRRRPTS